MTEAYPLKWPDGWPRARGREWGRFARNLDTDRTLDQLMDELRRLGATNIVISTNLKPRNVSARPDADPRVDPGVAIYFTYNAKSMSMAQDRFDNVGKNARSLTLAIDAMRAIERHGGGYMMQRSFDGFAALPPPSDGKGYEKRPWRSVLELSMPLRLSPMTASRGMLPVARVQFGVGRCGRVAADAEQRTEGVEGVKSPIEAERELVEVRLHVLRADAVVAAAQPRLEVAEHQMDDGQVFLCHDSLATLRSGQMLVSRAQQPIVAAPAVRHDHGARLHRPLYEATQGLGGAIRHDGQAKPPGIPAATALLGIGALFRLPLANLNSRRHKRLMVDASAFTTGRAANPSLVHFNVISGLADPVSIRAYHSGAQLVQNLESRLVPLEAKLTLKLRGAHPRRVAGDQIGRPEPRPERRVGALHDRTGRQRHVATALAAAQYAGAGGEPERLCRLLAVWTGEAASPPDALKVGRTSRIVGEHALELRQALGEGQIGTVENVHGLFPFQPRKHGPQLLQAAFIGSFLSLGIIEALKVCLDVNVTSGTNDRADFLGGKANTFCHGSALIAEFSAFALADRRESLATLELITREGFTSYFQSADKIAFGALPILDDLVAGLQKRPDAVEVRCGTGARQVEPCLGQFLEIRRHGLQKAQDALHATGHGSALLDASVAGLGDGGIHAVERHRRETVGVLRQIGAGVFKRREHGAGGAVALGCFGRSVGHLVSPQFRTGNRSDTGNIGVVAVGVKRIGMELSIEVYGALPKANQLILAEAAYRQTSRAAHPDVPGGSAERMAELNVAIEDARSELRT